MTLANEELKKTIQQLKDKSAEETLHSKETQTMQQTQISQLKAQLNHLQQAFQRSEADVAAQQLQMAQQKEEVEKAKKQCTQTMQQQIDMINKEKNERINITTELKIYKEKLKTSETETYKVKNVLRVVGDKLDKAYNENGLDNLPELKKLTELIRRARGSGTTS